MSIHGRDAELGVIRGELERLLYDGTEAAVVVEGAAGMGKSRLLAEVAAIARSLGVRVDQGQPQTFNLGSATPQAAIKLTVARGLAAGQHKVVIANLSGENAIDGFIVRRAPDLTIPLLVPRNLLPCPKGSS